MAFIGKTFSKIGEIGSKAGGTIKEIATSEAANKLKQNAKKGTIAAAKGAAKGAVFVAGGAAKGAVFVAGGMASGAKKAAKGISAKIEEKKANKENSQSLVDMNLAGIRILIPDRYEYIKNFESGDERVDKSPEKFFFEKRTGSSYGIFGVFETLPEYGMDFDNDQQIIDDIHEGMDDNQGLICVKSGDTKRGYKYVYSIVKTISDKGASYILRINLKNKANNECVAEIQGQFYEMGSTGLRDCIGMELAERLNLVKFKGDKMVGWNEDPYDKKFTRGIPMNLSERIGLDGMFPDHPLSQARELVQAVLFDELIDYAKEQADSDESKSEENMTVLFEKGEILRRHTYEVEI